VPTGLENDSLETLDELANAVFGREAGDTPNVYQDYDSLVELERRTREAIAALKSSTEVTSAVQSACEVEMVQEDEPMRHSPAGKSFLRLKFNGGRENGGLTLAITTNLGEMIGGAAAGLRKRREDLLRRGI
jgi:hypothetical protein